MSKQNYGRPMRFQVLGPVRATRDGDEVPLGGPQQRLVLALLLAENGRPVSTSRLIDGIWGEDEPATAKKALQGYVHHLRTQIGDDLKTEGNGYSLATNGDLDAHEFERLRSEAVELGDVDPDRSAELLRRALNQWNGAPYADLGDFLALAPEIARLEDLRVTALGDRVEADLALGRHTALVGELEALTQEYPLHERFRAQHMTALYRAGRQVEALRSYERFRRHLGDEMGLDPSAELRELEGKILSDDEQLKAAPSAGTSDPVAVRGYELRDVVASSPAGRTYRAYQRSIGRQVAVRMLGADVADDADFIANFLTDTKEVAALEHPHISVVFDTWRGPGNAYQVSRWFGGGSVADVIAAGPVSTTAALRILDEIGDALGHAHRSGVVHGHVTAANVMLDESGHAYLTDFVVGSRPRGDQATDRTDFAVLAHHLLVGQLPAHHEAGFEPPTDSNTLTPGLRSVFEIAFSEEGYARPEHLVRALRQALGVDVTASETKPARTEVRNPYKGLQAFQEIDAADFHGRAEVVDRITAELDRHRLVAVVGPSGSGKSSVVKAGLIPRLRARDGGPVQLITEMFPGAYPFEELEDALLRVGVKSTSVLADLLADERGLARVLRQILPTDDAELLLVIDQFEELFSMVADEEARQLFLDSLVAAVADPRSRLRVVLTMRADFFDRPLGYPRFGEVFEAALVPLKVPDDDELAQAITEPARALGVDFEEGLVERIVADVSGQPGGLPLLQYALTELFDARESNRITLATYQRGGGVFGALARRAEELYDDLPAPGKAALRHAMLGMVTVDEGADDLRRRVRRADLRANGIDDRQLSDALQVYGAHRLLTFDLDPATSSPTVEVAHEALLREWPRMREWIEEQRDDLVMRRRLDAALAEWKAADEEDSYLPSGSRLAQFDEWSQSTTLALGIEEQSFLEAAAEREASAQARAANRRRMLTIALTVATVVFGVLAGFAFTQQRNANNAADEAAKNAELAQASSEQAQASSEQAQANSEQAQANSELAQANAELADDSALRAETGRLASAAAARATTNPVQALLLAREAYERDPGPETLGALQQVMLRAEPLIAVLGNPERQYLATKWSDPAGVLVLLHTEGVEIYDSESLERLHEASIEVAIIPEEVAWEGPDIALDVGPPDGVVAVGATGSTVVLVDLKTYERTTIEQDAFIFAVELSDDSSQLAIATWSGSVEIWNLDDRTLATTISGHPETTQSDFTQYLLDAGVENNHFWVNFSHGEVAGFAFSPDGSLLVSAAAPIARVWDTQTGTLANEFTLTHEGYPFGAVNFLPTGPGPLVPRDLETVSTDPWIVRFAGYDRLVDYDVNTGARVAHFEVPTDTTMQATKTHDHAVLPSGLPVVSLSDDRVRVLADDGSPAWTYESLLPTLGQLDISPEGSRVAAAADGGVMILALDDRSPLASSTPMLEPAQWLSITSDQRLIATAEFERSQVYEQSDSGYVPVERRNAALWRVYSFGQDDIYEVAFDWSEDPRASLVEASLYRTSDSDELEFVGQVFWDGRSSASAQAGEWLAGPNNGWVEVYDMTTFDLRARLPLSPRGGAGGVSLTASTDGSRLLGANQTGDVGMWDTKDWTIIDPPVPLEDVVGVSYSPDGRYLATVASDGVISLREADSMEVLRELVGSGPPDGAGLAWSNDGRHLVSTFDNRSARLWDVESGVQIGDPFPNSAGTVAGSATADVPRLVTSSGDSLLTWNLDTSTWADIACNAAGRNLTRAEWEQFGPRDTEYRATCPQYPLESAE